MEAGAKRTVVVGVDGSPTALAAARYALWRAELSGLGLVVVHAYTIPALQEPLSEGYTVGVREAARDVLDRVVARLDIPPTVGVRKILQPSSPALLLRGAATTARLVVIGQGADGWLERRSAQGLVHSLCTSVGCPVVVTPKDWQPTEAGSRPVVVAVRGGLPAAASLQVAFEEAELRDTTVVALQAMPAAEYPHDLASRQRNLAELVAGSKQDYPRVRVEVRSVGGDASEVLIESSLTASVLVVSYPHSARVGAWTSSVARSVLGRTGCPIVVMPREAEAAARHNDGLARAGR